MVVGAESEFADFVAARSMALFRTAYFLSGGDRHTAQDLVQDALADTYARWSTIRDPHAREAYVRRVMVRKATRHWKRRSRVEISTDSLPDSGLASHDDAVAAEYDLTVALTSLSPRQRAVVVLRYYDDLSETEIAQALGVSSGAVKTHASRALKALGIALDGTLYDPAATTREGS